MMRSSFPFVSMALAAVLAGCGGGGGDPLDGTWSMPVDQNLTRGTQTLTLNADGTASTAVAYASIGSDSCTGSTVADGVTWTATPSTITFAGTATCKSTVKCKMGGAIPCESKSTDAAMKVGYTLENGDDTLVLQFPDGTSGTFTRTN
jgi:hypothetical protein